MINLHCIYLFVFLTRTHSELPASVSASTSDGLP